MFGITRLNAVVSGLVYSFDYMSERIVAGEDTVAVTFQDEAFIVVDDIFEVELVDGYAFAGRIDAVYLSRVDILEHFVGLLEDVHVHYFVVDVILTKQADGAGFHPQVDILGDQDGLHVRIFAGQPVCHG